MAYVDAQRNVAVALGERDVKTDVTKVSLSPNPRVLIHFLLCPDSLSFVTRIIFHRRNAFKLLSPCC